MTRAEAIDILKNTIVRFGRTNGKTAYAEALQMAITALEEPQWIPCSITDDLPDHEVLCCDLRGEMLVGYLYVDESSDTGFGAESEGECLVDCVAWREKPEPPKEGDPQ